MRLGKLLTQSSLPELRATTVTRLRITTPDVSKALEILRAQSIFATELDAATVMALPEHHRSEDINRVLVGAGVAVQGLTLERPALEDIFVSLTGEGFDVAQ